jgi:hypothetical protein
MQSNAVFLIAFYNKYKTIFTKKILQFNKNERQQLFYPIATRY